MSRRKPTYVAVLRFAAVIAMVAMATATLTACGINSASDDTGVAPMESFGGAERGVDGDYAVEDEALSEAQSMPAAGTGDDAANVAAEDRLIIRNKSLRLEVDDVRESVDSIRDSAETHKAIITNVNVASDNGPIYRYDEYGGMTGSGAPLSGWITVRVPADSYDAFIADVSGLGEIKWEGESTDDVTQEHVDLSARLQNLQAEEARLREFFDAATDVEDMLMVERELNRVRGEIESMTAQIAYLERQAAMATVTIELSEPSPIIEPDGPDWGFKRAITAGLQLAANVVKALIVVLIGALPLIAIAAVLFLVVRAVLKARRKKIAGGTETTKT